MVEFMRKEEIPVSFTLCHVVGVINMPELTVLHRQRL